MADVPVPEMTAAAATVRIAVAASLRPGQAQEWALQLPAGATLADALAASAALGYLPDTSISDAGCGIWGQRTGPGQVLRDGDRVELYRPLTVDPKVARRERFARQGARTAGLFAGERGNPGQKSKLRKSPKGP